jgi:hypothetical protein
VAHTGFRADRGRDPGDLQERTAFPGGTVARFESPHLWNLSFDTETTPAVSVKSPIGVGREIEGGGHVCATSGRPAVRRLPSAAG